MGDSEEDVWNGVRIRKQMPNRGDSTVYDFSIILINMTSVVIAPGHSPWPQL